MNTIVSQDIPLIDVCNKEVIEYVSDCLSVFNRGADTLVIRAVSGNVSKAVEVAKILSDYFGIIPEPFSIDELKIGQDKNPCLKIRLRCGVDKGGKGKAQYSSEVGFIDFPDYHLLIDALLNEVGQLDVCEDEHRSLITITKETNGCGIAIKAEEKDTLNDLEQALHRCALLLSPNWHDIAEVISRYDDVILGVDTNILYNCVLSEHLLNEFSVINPKEYVSSPGWILVVVPAAVMHELEQAANIRDSKGFLLKEGRMAFRAIQEILELDQSCDLPGVSLIIAGEANPTLDTRHELKGLRRDLSRERARQEGNRFSYIHFSSGDTIIRDQIKHFAKMVDFHKGLFFLTSDKSNAALAKAEGLHPIYYKVPKLYNTPPKGINPPNIHCESCNPDLPITIRVPVGKLVYEVAVQFGSVRLKWDSDQVELRCDRMGENLEFWLHKKLWMEKGQALSKILKNYELNGKFSLKDVEQGIESLRSKMGSADIIT